MELYEINTSIGKKLSKIANEKRLPLGGTIELTPLCNMNCKMCYIHQTKEEMLLQGSMLSSDQWISILEDARNNGVLYLLVTGGEPLLYPEFKKFYTTLVSMGFFVSLNTNGTLIDETWADFFYKYPCKQLNITLYGKDNETYKKLCNNPNGFSQVTKAIRLLKERNITFVLTSSLNQLNYEQMPELYNISQQYDALYKPASYMFPTMRRKITTESQMRLSPEIAAQTTFLYYKLSKNEGEMKDFVHSTLLNLFMPPRIGKAVNNGYPCRGGKSGFWINWKGEMTSCAMLEQPSKSLTQYSFKECWDYIVEQTLKTQYCQECITCPKQNICHVCPAAVYTETNSFTEKPDYLCRYTDELINCLINTLPDSERYVYMDAVINGGFKQLF